MSSNDLHNRELGSISFDDFRGQLIATQLMTEAELAAALERLRPDERPTTGAELAMTLVEAGKLTGYQAIAISDGAAHPLVLNNYTIVDEIGRGGMGHVYKAVHQRMERIVAIKVLSPHAITSGDSVSRFHREVKTAAQLVHPNIVTAFDADAAGDTHYLVMEHVTGCDLSWLVKEQGPLSVNQTISCICQAAEGLAFAHDRGIVHRDVKPSNLLVNTDGVVKVLDLGLAQYEQDQVRLTRTGQVMGTYDYISPEQIATPNVVDARSDIYSLGCTLYALVTGHAMYEEHSTLEKLEAHRSGEIPRLCDSSATSETAPLAHLDSTYALMVAKRPKDRIPSMRDVIEALQKCLLPGQSSVVVPPKKSPSVDIASLLQGGVTLPTQIGGQGSVTEDTIQNAGVNDTSPGSAISSPRVKGYELLEEIGRGAMGVVYKARHEKLNRVVALKLVVAGSTASPQELARFQTEAEAVAMLQHPNIVQIFEVGRCRRGPFCAFEYVDGGTLADAANGEPVDIRQAASWVRQLAEAIDLAHRQGIVHRDLKPNNVLMTSSQTPKITDFGLARRLEHVDTRQTKTGAILGSPAYMSPEQALGKREIGSASDIYSLGVILFELLTGDLPFKADSVVGMMQQIKSAEAPSLRQVRRTVPPDLETICLKCLAKEPDRRYPTAAALAADLRAFLDDQPISARQRSLPATAVRYARRQPALVCLTIALMIVTALCVVLLIRRPDSAEVAADPRGDAVQVGGQTPYEAKPPAGLPAFQTLSRNPMTVEKIELGRQLFFDKRLSIDDSVSCATCHDPDRGWSDGKPLAVGVNGQVGTRHSPSIINVAYAPSLMWDGRLPFLESQPLAAILNPAEMAMPSEAVLVEKVEAIEEYQEAFSQAFDDGVTANNTAMALAAFQRTVLSGDAPYDRFRAGDEAALSPEAELGRKLFFGKAHCSACHSGPNFSDGSFHNIGIGLASDDVGRESESGRAEHHKAFKTPTLREIARTAPYMHDGSLATLKDVVDFYDRGGVANPQLDEEIFPLHLTDEDKQHLLAFLREALTGSVYPDPR